MKNAFLTLANLSWNYYSCYSPRHNNQLSNFKMHTISTCLPKKIKIMISYSIIKFTEINLSTKYIYRNAGIFNNDLGVGVFYNPAMSDVHISFPVCSMQIHRH